MPPEEHVARFLDRARRRLLALAALQVLSAGALAAAATLLIGRAGGVSGTTLLLISIVAAIVGAGVAAWRIGRWRTSAEVERRTPTFRNTLITSDELLTEEQRVTPQIRALVLRDTSARIDDVDLRRLVPARGTAIAAAVSAAALIAVVAAGAARTDAAPSSGRGSGTAATGVPGLASIELLVAPPAYTGLREARYDNPDRVELIEGSTLVVRARSSAGSVMLTAGDRTIQMTGVTDDTFEASLTIGSEAFLSLVPGAAAERARAVIQLLVTPDGAPEARIEKPGRDLMLADAARDIPIEISASDDFGLTGLSLAYTKVSGSGESFEFVEGTLPLAVRRANTRGWTASATIRPSALGLAAGDMVVYRAIVRDTHPARAAVESESFVIEMVSQSEAMAEGFSIDDQRDTYALSQQMVIIKTERLIAARRTMTREAVAEAAAMISVEQRRVRAEFVFMMGGEVEDEEVEAEHSNELEQGREQNRGRRDLLAAIRSMSDAAALLMRPDIDQALTMEKRALTSLQRAFTRSRYILRVLSQRERIDDSRRLSGDRSTAAPWRRAAATQAASAARVALAGAIVRLSAFARLDAYSAGDRAALTSLAETLLRLTPPQAGVRDAAAALARAAREDGAGAVAALVDEAALHIDAALEASASSSAAAAQLPAPHAVRSALADRLRGVARQ